MHADHDKPASFHSSPQEAMQAPPEEFLYLACLHEGTGVEAPDFLAVVDAEEGQIVHELPMPNVGDELHHFGWNRCSSACHGPDRSHLIVPGLPLVALPHRQRRRRPAQAADREGDRAGGGHSRDRLHPAPHRPLHARRQHRRRHARRRRRERLGRLRRARRADVRGQGPLGERRRAAAAQLRLLVPAAQERRSSRQRVRGAERLREGLRPRRTSRPGATGSRIHFWDLETRTREQTIDLGEKGLVPLEVRWLHDPDADEGFVGAALSSVMWHFHRDNGAYAADPVIEVESVPLEGWPFPVPGPDHRPRPLDGRPLPLLRQLAARRHPPVRRLGPAQAEADRPALARRGDRQADRRRPAT